MSNLNPETIELDAPAAGTTEISIKEPIFSWLRTFVFRSSVRQALVVLIDQGGYSIATFLTGMFIARACTKPEYGTYVLGMILVFFSGVIQSSLVTIPFSVLSQPLDRRQRSVYLGSSLLQHIALSFLIAAGFALTWGFTRTFGYTTDIVTLLMPLAAIAVAEHFRIFIRYVLLAELRPWASFAMGLITNIIKIGSVIGLYLSGRLTVPAACLVVAVASISPAGAVLLAERVKFSIKLDKVRQDFIKNWRYGRWLLTSTGANVIGIRALPWLTLLWFGREVVAIVGVVTTVACIARPALEASSSYLIPKLASYAHSHGIASARKKTSILIRLAAGAGVVYVLMMLFFGDILVGILYTSKYQGHAIALAIITAALSVKMVEVPVRAFLMAINRSKTLYHSSICASLATLVAAFVVVPRLGVVGVASAILVHYTTSLVVNYFGMILWSARLAKSEGMANSGINFLDTLFEKTYVNSGAREIIRNTASVLKKADPKYAKTEITVTQAAHNIAITSGLFYVPAVLGYDLKTGTIELERVDGLVTLRDKFASCFDGMDVLRRVGTALAYLHKNLQLPTALKRPVKLGWKCNPGDIVCLHGDFNINNVCCQQVHNRIVLLDWASAGVIGRGKTVGSRYFDLGNFLRSLLCQQRYLLNAIVNFNRRAEAFLTGYQQELGISLDRLLARRYLLKMTSRRIWIQLRRRHLKRAIGNSVAYLILWVLSIKLVVSKKSMTKLLFRQRERIVKTLRFEGANVIKKLDPALIEIEAEVTQAAHRLSCSTNLFYCPRVLNCDPHAGILTLEYVNGIIPLSEHLANTDDGIRVIHKVGKALAYVHGRLAIPENVMHPVPKDWSVQGEDFVTLHGDFNLTNVCYHKDSDQIVILDWATGPAFKFACTVGPKYLDLAYFIRSLLLQQKSFFTAIRLFRQRTDAFLQAYEKELGRPVNLELLGWFLRRVNIASLRKQWRRKMMISLSQTLLGQVILRNLTKEWIQKSHVLSQPVVSSRC
ncbi:MAG: hypothetical protein JW947_01060 [Sedimentisphaerales bacterium]|nr:hypothetical protein [Sedimentisphaerales bacterium]